MPPSFACDVCHAPGALTLPSDSSQVVVCSACHARRPRRVYEVQRLQGELARAVARAGAIAKPSLEGLEAEDPARCPVCGDDLFTRDHGCTRCGYGKRSYVARHPGVVAGAVALLAVAVASLGLFTVGTVSKNAPWVHVMLFGMSMIFVGGGVYAIQRPAGLPMAANAGTDAFGMQQYGATTPSTAEQGTQFGAIMLTVGLVLLAMGVFFGTLAG